MICGSRAASRIIRDKGEGGHSGWGKGGEGEGEGEMGEGKEEERWQSVQLFNRGSKISSH